jgi:hypothetical protein
MLCLLISLSIISCLCRDFLPSDDFFVHVTKEAGQVPSLLAVGLQVIFLVVVGIFGYFGLLSYGDAVDAEVVSWERGIFHSSFVARIPFISFSLGLICCVALILFSTDHGWDRLYSSHGYLSVMNRATADYSFGFFYYFNVVFGQLALLVIVIDLISYFFSSRVSIPTVAYGIMSVLLFLASGSRFSAVILLCLSVYFVIHGQGFAKFFKLASCVLVALLCFSSALYARGQGDFGIGMIPDFLYGGVVTFPSAIGSFYISITSGTMLAAMALTIGGSYPAAYKILSFSPFPSSLDGFVLSDQVRIDLYTPFPALAEAYLFGMEYFIGYLLIWGILSYHCGKMYARFSSQKILGSNAGLLLLMSAPIIFIYFLSTQYPIRNSMKLIIGMVVILYLFNALSSRAKGARV